MSAKQGWANGGMIFAATLMIVMGIYQIFVGIAAIAQDQFFVVGAELRVRVRHDRLGLDPPRHRRARRGGRVLPLHRPHVGPRRRDRARGRLGDGQLLLHPLLPALVAAAHRDGHLHHLGGAPRRGRRPPRCTWPTRRAAAGYAGETAQCASGGRPRTWRPGGTGPPSRPRRAPEPRRPSRRPSTRPRPHARPAATGQMPPPGPPTERADAPGRPTDATEFGPAVTPAPPGDAAPRRRRPRPGPTVNRLRSDSAVAM